MPEIPENQVNREEEWMAYLGGAGDAPQGAPYNRMEEWFLYMGGDGDEPNGGPLNRLEEWYAWMAENGGGSVSVEPLSVTENGTYTAEDNHAYSPVTVNVESSGRKGGAATVYSSGGNTLTIANVEGNPLSYVLAITGQAYSLTGKVICVSNGYAYYLDYGGGTDQTPYSPTITYDSANKTLTIETTGSYEFASDVGYTLVYTY